MYGLGKPETGNETLIQEVADQKRTILTLTLLAKPEVIDILSDLVIFNLLILQKYSAV